MAEQVCSENVQPCMNIILEKYIKSFLFNLDHFMLCHLQYSVQHIVYVGIGRHYEAT